MQTFGVILGYITILCIVGAKGPFINHVTLGGGVGGISEIFSKTSRCVTWGGEGGGEELFLKSHVIF